MLRLSGYRVPCDGSELEGSLRELCGVAEVDTKLAIGSVSSLSGLGTSSGANELESSPDEADAMCIVAAAILYEGIASLAFVNGDLCRAIRFSASSDLVLMPNDLLAVADSELTLLAGEGMDGAELGLVVPDRRLAEVVAEAPLLLVSLDVGCCRLTGP